MSLFGGFQDAWSRRFPGCELPQQWEDDVRNNLVTHRHRVAVLKEELEKESFYVEYLERLLAEVEKHRKSVTLPSENEPLESKLYSDSETIRNDTIESVAFNGKVGKSLLAATFKTSDDEERSASSDDKPQPENENIEGAPSNSEKNVENTDCSKENQFVTVIEVGGVRNMETEKLVESDANHISFNIDENKEQITEGCKSEEEDSKSQSDSSYSSPSVNKKKIPPKPPPKKPRPNLAYKGSLKVTEDSKQAAGNSIRSQVKSLQLEPKSGTSKFSKSLTKSDSVKSNSSLDEYEELQSVLRSMPTQILVDNNDDYVNITVAELQKGDYDDNTMKSQASVQSGHSSNSGLSDNSRVTEGEASPAAGIDDEDEFTSEAEMAEETSPKYSDYVNIDYFLKKRARLKPVRAESRGESEVGTAIDYSDDDDDGMGLLLHTLVNSGNVSGSDEKDEHDPRNTVIEKAIPIIVGAVEHSKTSASENDGPHASVNHNSEEHDVLDGDSGVYSSSVESTSFLCPSTPPASPAVGKNVQLTPAPITAAAVRIAPIQVQNDDQGFIGPVAVADGAEAERITMVKCIVNSILESESIYWECLNVLLQYMKALRSTIDTSQPVISREDIGTIFYKIPELHGLHLAFLDGIKNSLLHNDGRIAIGDHFKHLASRLGVYASYLQNYSHAIETVRKCSAENTKFGDITKSIKLQALKGQAVSLEDLLHKPVARVQKNALVLHDLLKYTSEFNPDYKSLQTALRMTQCFLNEFNMSATESMFPAHDRTQRHLVKNSFIVELSEGRRKLRHLFLFNDVIVCAKYKMSGREKFTYEVKWYIPLCDAVLPTEEGFVREVNPVNLISLKSQVASIRDLISKEELASKEKSWGSARSADKYRKRLAELQAQIMLASPNLLFRLGQKNGRNYYFYLSSKFERCQWIEAITAVQATAPQTTTTLTLCELQAWITACHRFLQTNMGSFLLKSGKEDDLLVGDMHVIVHSMQELNKPSDIYLCLEVDSYGHFFRKAITDVCRFTVEPEWNQEFVIDLEGSQMLRILCYEEVPGHEAIVRGKAAIELNKSWLTNQFQEKKISLQECTLSLSLKFSQRERTLSRVPSSKSCAVFGLKISQVAKREKREIPFLISCCLREVEKRGMHELGIYRVSGPVSELQKLKRAFETNPYDAEQMVKELDIHSVTGILKLYLRELPEGLFTDELYPKFLEAFSLVDAEMKSKTLLTLFNSLPSPNNVIVNYLIEHMIRIIKEEAHNKMSLQNVATVFGPTLLRPSIKSESGNMSDKLAAGTIDVMAQAGILYFYLKRKAAGESLVITPTH